MDYYGYRRRQEYESAKEIRDIDDTYVFDASSGLYKPKSYDARDNSKEQTQNHIHKVVYESPIHVKTRRDWLSIIISLLTLIVLGVYTIFTSNIYQASEASAVGTIQAAWAAKSAADSAKKGLETSEKFFRRDQRAYVWVKMGTFIDGIGADHKLGVNLQTMNTGKTPAQYQSHYGLMTFQNTSDLDAEDRAFNVTESIKRKRFNQGVPVIPGQTGDFFTLSTIEEGAQPKWTTEELSNISATPARKFVYVAGTLEYSDVFGDQHRTEFCIHWSATNNDWEFCKTHNKIE
jgi:hypothetical protein